MRPDHEPLQPEERTVPDAITLTIPRERPYWGVVRLVVGGLAARLDLAYDALEDVQLALESLLVNDAYAAAPTATIEVAVDGGALSVLVGPLRAGRLDDDLARDDAAAGVGLGRLLTTVMGGYDVERRDGAEWVRMRKDLERAERV